MILVGNSCRKVADNFKDVNPGKSSTYPVSGEWWVIYSLNGAPQGDYFKLMTYNLATDKGDSIWVDDSGDFWQETIKIKSKVDVKNKSFSVTDSPNASGNGTSVTLVGGKVLLGAAKTTSGNKSDSIFVKFVYSDDAADTFYCAGYRRTGFQADDH